MHVICIHDAITDGHVINANALLERIGHIIRKARRVVEEVKYNFPEIAIEIVDEFDLSVAGVNSCIGAVTIKGVGAMKSRRRLLPVASDEGVHAMEEANFVLVVDISICREKPLRL